MRRVLFIIFVLVASTVFADLGSLEPWTRGYNAGPYDETFTDRFKEREGAWPVDYAFIEINTVKLKSQDMVVTFEYPDTVAVYSDYIFDVLGPTGTVLVGYVPDKYFDWEGNVYKPGAFEVSVDGETVDPSDVILPKKIVTFEYPDTPDTPVNPMVIFPVAFGDSGERKVAISYWYRLKHPFVYRIEEGGEWVGEKEGFYYSFEPARLWAGGVDKIEITLKVVGGEVSDLGDMWPDDFHFTADGCHWVWTDVTDEQLNVEGMYSLLGIFYSGPTYLGGEFTTVLADAGLNVRSGPGTGYPIISTLGKGSRVYVLDRIDWRLGETPGLDTYWVRCRLLDNTEGYIAAIYEGEYLLDCYGYRKQKYAPLFSDE